MSINYSYIEISNGTIIFLKILLRWHIWDYYIWGGFAIELYAYLGIYSISAARVNVDATCLFCGVGLNLSYCIWPTHLLMCFFWPHHHTSVGVVEIKCFYFILDTSQSYNLSCNRNLRSLRWCSRCMKSSSSDLSLWFEG